MPDYCGFSIHLPLSEMNDTVKAPNLEHPKYFSKMTLFKLQIISSFRNNFFFKGKFKIGL